MTRDPDEINALGHPGIEAIDRYLAGRVTADEELVRHIQGCDQCLREVEAARDVTAALSMLSAPPNDLRERIRSRRAAGERVLLPFESDIAVAADAKTAPKVRNRRWRRPVGLAVASM